MQCSFPPCKMGREETSQATERGPLGVNAWKRGIVQHSAFLNYFIKRGTKTFLEVYALFFKVTVGIWPAKTRPSRLVSEAEKGQAAWSWHEKSTLFRSMVVPVCVSSSL